MANLKLYNDLLQDIKSRKFKPAYLLHGEEPFYIDKLSKQIEELALEEHERDFNLNIFYGRDLEPNELLETAKRFPMMAERQLVIVREAQDYDGKWADFESYFENPVASTILIINLKYKSATESTAWVKAIAKHGVVFHSTKHYDNEIPQVVRSFVQQHKYRISSNAAELLADYLGNDLEKIEMEVQKLTISVPLSKEIAADDIHRLIGVSKEFNIYEYVNALTERDNFKSFRIAKYLGRNEKNNPMVLIIVQLFNQFSKMMMYHSLKSKDMKSVMAIPGIRGDYAAKKLVGAAGKFNMRKTAQVITLLREMDARYKGVDSAYTETQEDLLKEMTYKILN